MHTLAIVNEKDTEAHIILHDDTSMDPAGTMSHAASETLLTSINEALHRELALAFEPAKHLKTTKIIGMLPAQTEDAYHFFSAIPCFITLDKFIEDILRLPECTDKVVIWALILLQRVAERDARLKISSYTVVRLFTTAIVVARKAAELYIPGDNMRIFTRHWRPTENEMRQNELALLMVLNCNVNVSDEEFRKRLKMAGERTD